MNKTKKGFLSAASIITIVASAFAILMGLGCFMLGGMVTEDVMKESYLEDTSCVYCENADGSYYFIETDETGAEIITTEEDIELLVNVVSAVIKFGGFIILGVGIAKLVLAIRILIMNNKDKYSKGCTIGLLVLSVLNTNILEAVFLIVAMCSGNKQQIENPPAQDKPETDVVVE